MKRLLLSALLLPMMFIASCSDDDDDSAGAGQFSGTYVGSFNVSDPSYQNTSYTVSVTHLSDLRIRIAPGTSHGTAWEVNLMKVSNSLYTCVSCLTNQVQINIGNNGTQLNYNFGNNEQFAGTRQ